MIKIFPKCFGEYNYPYGGIKEKGNCLFCCDCKIKEFCKKKMQENNEKRKGDNKNEN